ncbi:holo-ACP synthase [bacterium]|nr:holo-ACP synthase [bacterium]
MMILGQGCDIVQISDYKENVLKADPSQYLSSHFTLDEIEILEARNISYKAQHYAARWAAKEAFIKAINAIDLHKQELWIGWVDFKEIEVLCDQHERPYLRLSGKVKEAATKRNVQKIFVSLSHAGDYAMATVILAD